MTDETENAPTAPTGEPWAPAFDPVSGEPIPSDKPLPVPSEVVRHQAAQKTIAASRHERLDVTRRGGYYLQSDGAGGHIAVDANGVPITDATPEEIEAEIAERRKAAGPKRM